MLRKYLPPQTFEDYVYFIQMKSRLIMEARDVQDKIALGEEQLCALRQILV
jgi:protein Shroom